MGARTHLSGAQRARPRTAPQAPRVRTKRRGGSGGHPPAGARGGRASASPAPRGRPFYWPDAPPVTASRPRDWPGADGLSLRFLGRSGGAEGWASLPFSPLLLVKGGACQTLPASPLAGSDPAGRRLRGRGGRRGPERRRWRRPGRRR